MRLALLEGCLPGVDDLVFESVGDPHVYQVCIRDPIPLHLNADWVTPTLKGRRRAPASKRMRGFIVRGDASLRE